MDHLCCYHFENLLLPIRDRVKKCRLRGEHLLVQNIPSAQNYEEK